MQRVKSAVVGTLLLTVSVTLIPALSPDASAADRFNVYNIRVLDRITEIAAADLNGDGLHDLVVLHTKGYSPDTERWLSLFWQKPDGGFSSAADRTWKLSERVAAIDVGDVLEEPGDELIALTASGASIVRYSDSPDSSSLLPVITGVTGMILPSREQVPLLDFCQDWDGDGLDDILIPGLDGLSLFIARSETSFADPQMMDMEVRLDLSVGDNDSGSDLDAVSVTRRLPGLIPIDLDRDGDRDIVAHWDDQVSFHLQNDGEFSRSPDASCRLDLLTDEEKADGDFEVGVSVIDVDGDGLADLFGGKSASRGVADYSSSVVLHYGDGGLGFAGEPDWSISVQGMSRGRWLDIDGDGRKELMLPVIDLGLTDIVRILITKKVKVEFYFYFLSEDRSIPQEPNFTQEVTLKVGFEEEGSAQIVNLRGDYNGDGRKDMVVATGDTELSVFLGKEPSKGELFNRKPAEKIQVGTFGDFKPLDLNGDGRDDMILYYSGHPQMSSRARILVNLGPW